MGRLLFAALALSALPPGATEYRPDGLTQSIARVNERRVIRQVPVSVTPAKWHRPGGITADMGVTSRRFRSGGRPVTAVMLLPVVNSFGYEQFEAGITRAYPDGARFDDILFNRDGIPFEHRAREKVNGQWQAWIEMENESARPPGYVGMKIGKCTACHTNTGGTGYGGYGAGLAPGGDTVVSDPLDWRYAAGYR